MSTKTIEVVGRGSGWQKVGIELGSYVCNPNSSQPGMFQTFAGYGYCFRPYQEKNLNMFSFFCSMFRYGHGFVRFKI